MELKRALAPHLINRCKNGVTDFTFDGRLGKQ
jgi:hypothetical protein